MCVCIGSLRSIEAIRRAKMGTKNINELVF
jgi:hypothetical protein